MIVIFLALLLTISMGASTLLIPNAGAHTPPYQIPTYARIDVLPDPIGVGQSALGYAFLANAPPSGSSMANNYRFHDYTVIITDPTGEVQTLHWDTVVDTTGAQMFRFTPDVVGVYNITFNYGGQTQRYPQDTSSTANDGDVYLPSTASCTLTVQQEPIPTYPDSYPLPTEFWARPIYGENPYWWTISSNWLGVGSPVLSSVSSGTLAAIPSGQSGVQRYPGDAVGSLTSHVMWTKPIQEGGVVGGNQYEIAGDTYFEGSAYQQRFINPIIVYGRLFYREPVSFLGPSSGDSICVDLVTGEELWRKSDFPTISFAYIPDIQNPNQHGVFPALLCTSNFGQCYDMYTGRNVFNVTSMPGGTASGFVNGPSGEWIRYYIVNNGTSSAPNYYLAQWNSTKMLRGTSYHPGESGNSPSFDTTSTTTYQWVNTTYYENNVRLTRSENVSTTTVSINASRGNRYDYLDPVTQNISIPWRNTFSGSFSIIAAQTGDIMLCRNGSYPSLTGVTNNSTGTVTLNTASWQYFAINLNASKGTVGSILWWSPVYTDKVDKTITYGGLDPTADVFIEVCKETQNMVGISLTNGQRLWETDVVNTVKQMEVTPLDYFGNPYFPYVATQLAYGKIYSICYGGILFCYDLQTGVREWTYGNGGAGNSTDSGFQMPGPYPAFINGVGNGVIYIVSTQHTVITPIPKGNMVRAVNATDRSEIWKINSYVGEFSQMSFAMADGYTTWMNGYDNQIYTVGRGPSALSVSAPDLAAASNQPVVIKGTLYDISAGATQTVQAARFPNGIPLAADSAMTDWMGYVYQQKPLPDTFEGVTVDISVIDSNGNYRSIGTSETDAIGQYSIIWAPDISGTYQVVATFTGTNGYWPSTATTAFSVMEAAPTPTSAPIQEPSAADLYFVPAIAGLFVFVAIIGVVIILVLRKRP